MMDTASVAAWTDSIWRRGIAPDLALSVSDAAEDVMAKRRDEDPLEPEFDLSFAPEPEGEEEDGPPDAGA